MNCVSIILLFNIFVIISAKEFENKLDRYLITCHTTDFECFERQYRALRDHVLLGNQQLAIDTYEPYVVRYGDTGTCIRISGVEESVLVDISMDSSTKKYILELELPIKLQQIENSLVPCADPDTEFEHIVHQNGTLKKFAANGTFNLSYTFTLRKQKGQVYLALEDEDLDAAVDIPDLSTYNRTNEKESEEFMLTEWAYNVFQHVEVAQHCLAPYSAQLKKVMDRVPFEKFLMLYPEENYTDLTFSFSEALDDDDNLII